MKNNPVKRAFIVDDDPFWIEMLSQILQDIFPGNIHSFNNGEDCLKNIHLNPEVVFLDYQMDHLNGIDVLQKIKEYFPSIKVIFCTSHEDLSIATEAFKNGSYDYLLKENANKKEIINLLKLIV